MQSSTLRCFGTLTELATIFYVGAASKENEADGNEDGMAVATSCNADGLAGEQLFLLLGTSTHLICLSSISE
jgi:hypothetical protein